MENILNIPTPNIIGVALSIVLVTNIYLQSMSNITYYTLHPTSAPVG
jgi:hypothetical protein